MFNPNFDPLKDLEILKHNQMQLVNHIRQQDKLINDFSAHLMQISNALQGLVVEQSKLRQKVETFVIK